MSGMAPVEEVKKKKHILQKVASLSNPNFVLFDSGGKGK